jgi:CHAT domain-containing protein
MNRTARFLLIFLFAALLFSVKTTAQTETPVLEAGKPIERLLKAGETHTYKINAAANQYLQIEVGQIGADVVVKLYSPEGNKLLEVDEADGANSTFFEKLYAVTETAGNYRLEISQVSYWIGGYEAKISELRPSVPADFQIVKIATTMIEGSRLSGKYYELGKPPDQLNAAIDKFKEAITLFQATNNVGGEIDALQHIGSIYVFGLGRGSLKNISTGIEYFEKSLNLAEKLGDKKRTATALHNIGYANRNAGNHIKAREFYDKAFPIYEALSNKYLMSVILSSKGFTYFRLGDYDNALEQFQKAQMIVETIQNFAPQSLGNIGIIYGRKGNLWKALEYNLKALTHAEKFGGKGDIARSYMNVGMTYSSLGNNELAINYFQMSYKEFDELAKDNLDKSGVGTALLNIADKLRRQSRYNEALKKYQEALEIFERLKAQNWSGADIRIASILAGMGQVYYLQGDSKRFLEYFGRVLEISKTFPDKRLYVELLNAIAEHFVNEGNYEEARKNLEESATIAQENRYNEINRTINFTYGKLYAGLKQPLKARQFFDESIKDVETLRAQGSPFEGMTRPFIGMVGLLSSEGKTIEAFSYAEHAKSRSLLDVLQNGRIDITKAMSAEERETETRLKKEMVTRNTQISNEKDKARLDELNQQLQKKRLEFEDFKTRLYATKPELKIQRGEMKPISLEAAGKLLSDDKSAFLEYVVGDDKSFLFVITKDSSQKISLKVYPIEIKQKDLAKQTESFRSKIAKGDLDFAKSAQDLYNLLLKPAEAQLKNKTNLIIVPDSSLWDLPFQALQPAPNKYLIESSAISYAPSLTALNEMAKKNRGKQFSGATLLAFGNPTVNKETSDNIKRVFMSDSLKPLPEAERLVNSLQKMYGANRSKIFIGPEAREEIAKTESSKYRVVQFAAHGVLNDFSPMYSHIVLAQRQNNPNEDGLLEAWEMKDLDLNADMVILSACETARGKVSSGEGVIGMSWALFIAGAPTTVASQWKVESSSTTELMLEFHKQLLNGKGISKAEALRRASLKLMKMPQYKHPSYWAGFVMVGDGF